MRIDISTAVQLFFHLELGRSVLFMEGPVGSNPKEFGSIELNEKQYTYIHQKKEKGSLVQGIEYTDAGRDEVETVFKDLLKRGLTFFVDPDVNVVKNPKFSN